MSFFNIIKQIIKFKIKLNTNSNKNKILVNNNNMKKIFLFVFIVFMVMFGIYNPNYFNKKVFAKMENDCNLIVCIDNFDDASDEYKEKFWNLEIPLTFKTINKENYSNFNESDTKYLTNSIIIPKKYMSLVASGDATDMRNTIYNSVSIAKDQNVCILIFKINQENEETIYFALNDSLSIFSANKITLKTFNFIYS